VRSVTKRVGRSRGWRPVRRSGTRWRCVFPTRSWSPSSLGSARDRRPPPTRTPRLVDYQKGRGVLRRSERRLDNQRDRHRRAAVRRHIRRVLVDRCPFRVSSTAPSSRPPGDGQLRRLTRCVDAPAGSRRPGTYLPQARPVNTRYKRCLSSVKRPCLNRVRTDRRCPVAEASVPNRARSRRGHNGDHWSGGHPPHPGSTSPAATK
jgi:hypothetical protein